MVRFLLLALLAMLLVRAFSRLARGVIEGAGYSRTPERPSVSLVRDPVCGVFVAPNRALVIGSGPSAKYFCSEKCRRAWTDVSIPGSAIPNARRTPNSHLPK
jgi:YHS domain-containing protein